MRFLIAVFTILLLLPTFSLAKGSRGGGSSRSSGGSHSGHVAVRSHTRKTGTQVSPHHRSGPNRTQSDNWSTRGNVNPDTGKPGTKTPKK